MTIASVANRVSYPGAGSVGPFTVPFRFIANADLRVLRVSAANVETLLTLDNHYSLTGAGDAQGTLTLVTALAAGETLVIRRVPSMLQPTSLQNQASYFPKTHEDEYDRIVMQLQALKDQVDRAFGVPESVSPGAYTLTARPEIGKAVGWTSATELGNLNLGSSVISLPAAGRTVASLAAYLSNNAVFNVIDFGADPTGVLNSVAAFTAALAAAGQFGAIFVPPGLYVLNSAVTITGYQSVFGAGLASKIMVNHTGDGFLVNPSAGAAGPGQGSQQIVGLRFMNNAVTPAAFIAVTSASLSGSSNLLIASCFFGDTTVTTCVDNRTGYNTRIRDCVFTYVHCTQAVWFRQSTNDDPYWSYDPSVEGSDFTGCYGHGIRFDGAQGSVRNCVIQSCAGEGIWIGSSAGAVGRRNILSVEGCYFEGNTGRAIKSSRTLSATASFRIRIANSIFFDSGAHQSYLEFDGDTVFIESCIGNPGNRIVGSGIVRMRNCYSMHVGGARNAALEVHMLDKTTQYADATNFETFQNTLNVNGSDGGGAAIILCTHSTGVGNDTVAELFLIRFGNTGDNFTAVSLGRSAPAGDVSTFAFSVNLGYLAVNSGAGVAKYQLLTYIGKLNEDDY